MTQDRLLNRDKLSPNQAPAQTAESEREQVFTLPSDPNKAMQQMMNTIDQLREIYEEENEALAASDTQAFLGLQDRKIAAARDYQSGAKQMLERKGDLEHIDAALKQEMAAKQESFSGIMAENLKALDRMRKGVQRLNDRIMSSARDAARKDGLNYSASGNLNHNDRAISIGVSESA